MQALDTSVRFAHTPHPANIQIKLDLPRAMNGRNYDNQPKVLTTRATNCGTKVSPLKAGLINREIKYKYEHTDNNRYTCTLGCRQFHKREIKLLCISKVILPLYQK